MRFECTRSMVPSQSRRLGFFACVAFSIVVVAAAAKSAAPPSFIRRLSMSSLPIGEDVALSSRRCAAARYLYESVARDPVARVLAGDDIIASEIVNKDKNAVYPVVAVRTRWMDERIEEAFRRDSTIAQLVLCGAGMDARAYRMQCLRDCSVFELDIKDVLEYKAKTLASVTDEFPLVAEGVQRVDSDFSDDQTWLAKLKDAGFTTEAKTIWILEGFLYYFPLQRSRQMLQAIRQASAPGSLLLFDHINDFTLASLQKQASNKWLTTTFSSSMETPEVDLPTLGFHDVKVVTVGAPDAHYGIWRMPFVPREESKDIMRTYLIETRI